MTSTFADMNELQNASEDFKRANPGVFPEYASFGEKLTVGQGKTSNQYLTTIKRQNRKITASDKVSEADLQKEVVEFLQGAGYRVLVIRKARQRKQGVDSWVTAFGADGVGWPDAFAVKPGAKYPMIALELKSDTGTATPAQVEWLLVLSKCGVMTGIVTPANWNEVKENIRG